MFDYNYLKNIFIDNGGILKTSQLNGYGFSAYIINKLLLDGKIARVSRGHYKLMIMRLFHHCFQRPLCI